MLLICREKCNRRYDSVQIPLILLGIIFEWLRLTMQRGGGRVGNGRVLVSLFMERFLSGREEWADNRKGEMVLRRV